MDQRFSLLTFGVADIARSRAFYTDGLGWKEHHHSNENVVFYQMNGVVFGLYSNKALAEDAKVKDDGEGFRGVAVAYNARDREEVDAVMAKVVEAGGRLVKPAEEVFWGGYSGYVADPDGHLIEVAHNPFWEIDEAGNLLLPEEE